MAQYVVSVLGTDAQGQAVIDGRVVVYQDTELEAKIAGASLLAVDPDRVTVTLMGEVGFAPNSQIIRKQQ